MQQAFNGHLTIFIGDSQMKKIFLVLLAMFFVSTPLTAFAESPLDLPASANEGAKKHNQDGISNLKKGHPNKAIVHFHASEEIQRTGEVYFNEALAYYQLGKHGRARMHFNEAKTLANGNEKILSSKFLDLGSTNLDALPLNLPTDAEEEAKSLNLKGIYQLSQGHPQRAIKSFQASEDIERTGEAYYNEALAYFRMWKHGRAKMHYEEAKLLADGNVKIINSKFMKSNLKGH
jgi:tetratricopeptide (TPR) repeat protein